MPFRILFGANPFTLALAVLLTGILINWLIPLLIYAQKFGLFRPRPKNFIGCNAWGVVMDVVLVGILNLAVSFFLWQTNLPINTNGVMIAVGMGLLSMVATHIFMAATNWQEWIMPSPWHWNSAGFWHMFSMTVQMSFIFFPLVLLFFNPTELFKTHTLFSLAIALVCTILFKFSLDHKNATIKIGPFKISGKTW